MVEIGPGLGALTAASAATHADARRRSRSIATSPRPGAAVSRTSRSIAADALEFDFALPGRLRIVGNLPYNISTPLLFHLARSPPRVRDMHFMLQIEVVERMVAAHSTPAYGRLSVMLQARFEMEKLFNVATGAFRPPPKVDSAVVRMEPLAGHWRSTRICCAGRSPHGARRCATRCPTSTSRAAGIDPELRPENLSPEDYARLSMQSIMIAIFQQRDNDDGHDGEPADGFWPSVAAMAGLAQAADMRPLIKAGFDVGGDTMATVTVLSTAIGAGQGQRRLLPRRRRSAPR